MNIYQWTLDHDSSRFSGLTEKRLQVSTPYFKTIGSDCIIQEKYLVLTGLQAIK